LANLEDLRIAYSREQHSTWCRTLLDNIETARSHRDIFVDVVGAGIRHINESWFVEGLLALLEKMLPFQERPNQCGVFFECSEDNCKFILYEAFLYALATCIQAKKYGEARALLDHTYIAPEKYGGQRLDASSFTSFNSHPSSLEGDCADRGNSRRISVSADLVHDRATRKDIRFRDLLQADVIACIASSRNGRVGWYPRCTVHATEVGRIELFMRATNEQGFKPLKAMLGFSDGQVLIQHLCSDGMSRVWSHGQLWRCCDPQTMLNIDGLNRAWNAQQQPIAR